MNSQRPWLLEWVVAGIATATALGLVASALPNAHALWRDEVNSVVSASASSLADIFMPCSAS